MTSKYGKDEALQHVQDLYCESLEKYRYAHLLWFDTPNSNAYGVLFANVQGNISLLSFGEKHFLKILAKNWKLLLRIHFTKLQILMPSY